MLSAHHIVNLMELCLKREPCPNPKIIKNLTNFLCYDINSVNLSSDNFDVNSPKKDSELHIITLLNMQKVCINLLLLFIKGLLLCFFLHVG